MGSVVTEEESSSNGQYNNKVLPKVSPGQLSRNIHTHAGRLRQRAESDCPSLRSEWSRNTPPLFSHEPDPGKEIDSVSLQSDSSKTTPPLFSQETDTEERETPPSCARRRSLSSSDEHCLPSNWDQPDSLQPYQCDINGFQSEFKRSLKQKCERVCEGLEAGATSSLNNAYTELYITEGYGENVSALHEETQLHTFSKQTLSENTEDTPGHSIRCHDIFKQKEFDHKPIRVALSRGVAGVGKTFSVRKFCLDWALGLENTDLQLVVPLSFRELNLVRTERYSLLELIQQFYPSLQILAHTLVGRKVLFIFDGLDESCPPLNFKCDVISDITQRSEVSTLLVNLIKGRLLPDACIWITSRPAAVNESLVQYVDRFTEVRGFLNEQKKEYFAKRFIDKQQLKRVWSHVSNSRSLSVMCEIPVFCWITATVLDHMLRSEESGGPLPQTLTDMFARFILVQIQRKRKYKVVCSASEQTQADVELLLKLGKLAFIHLQRGNILFHHRDLQEVGLHPTDALLHSGLCTEIFKQESVIFNNSIYCFVHLSVQEFLAGVYALNCFSNKKEGLNLFLQDWNRQSLADVFLKAAMEKSLRNPSGQLDLFVRFLHGLTLESNWKLLGDLPGPTWIDSQTRLKVIANLKKLKTKTSPDRSINIFHCLTEMNDHSVHQQIQDYLQSENRSVKISDIQCSALAYVLQMQEEVMDEVDLNKYNASRAGRLRLVPAVRNCTKAVLIGCGLSRTHMEVVASALKARNSHLKFLDLSGNLEVNSAMALLCDGLRSQHCRLKKLILNDCGLTESSCASLASALLSNPSHLQDLELGDNPDLSDSGVSRLCTFLQSPHCRLEILRLWSCNLSELSCSSLASALKSNPKHLIDLKLGNNPDLEDSGVRPLCELLQSSDCRLEILELNNCGLSEFSCSCLVSALMSNPCSRLKALELGENRHLKDSGVERLCGFLQSPNCRLEILRLWSCRLTAFSCSSLASALQSNPSYLRELDLHENPKLEDLGVEHLCGFLQSPDCRLETLVLSSCSLSVSSCSSLVQALQSGSSRLKELDVRNNDLTASDVEELRRRLDSVLRWDR